MLNALKCKFFQTKLPYLGHIWNMGRSCQIPVEYKPFPVPTTALRTFLGMAQFCDRFIPNFSVLLAPLHQLTRRNVAFRWTEQCQQVFAKIKELLMQYPVLHPPSSNSVLVLETDASDLGTGHCLKALEVTGSINDIKTF